MIFSYNWLKDYISGKMPTPEKLAELLTFHSFEVEELKKAGKDWLLDIDVLPNRAHDCLSHLGVSREAAVLTGAKLKMPQTAKGSGTATKGLKVAVKDSELCPRYTAKVIKGVKVGKSPQWMSQRLKACGLQSINNIVDIINYVMLETGQPMHAFDADKVQERIIIRRAKKEEKKFAALDDKTYKIDENVLVVADAKGAVAIAGIKGGERTGIDSKTKNVIIEAGNWQQRNIRQTSKKLKLRTDASWRFENGLDPNLIDFSQERAAFLIEQMTGGRAVKGLTDIYPQKVKPKKVQLDLDYLDSLLGIKIPKSRVIKILESLGLKIENCKLKILNVGIPTFRLDVSTQEDLVEEVGRVFGYQNIPSVFPETALKVPERNEAIFWQRGCQNILKENGFLEIYNYSFIGEKDKDIFGLDENSLWELENPISSFYKYLRPSLVLNLLKNVKEQLKHHDEIKIFEIGKTFIRAVEKKRLAGLWLKKEGKEVFYELKGVIDNLFNKIGISQISYDEHKIAGETGVWHPGKCAQIKINGQAVGFLGEAHPEIIDNLKIGERVQVFDLDFEKIVELASEEHEYQAISSYPAAVRDLAVLVPQGTKVAEVLNKVNQAGGKLVRAVDVFDIYSGKGVPDNKENLAFHIIYQSNEKTLSSNEVDKIHQKIIKALEQNPAWQVRR